MGTKFHCPSRTIFSALKTRTINPFYLNLCKSVGEHFLPLLHAPPLSCPYVVQSRDLTGDDDSPLLPVDSEGHLLGPFSWSSFIFLGRRHPLGQEAQWSKGKPDRREWEGGELKKVAFYTWNRACRLILYKVCQLQCWQAQGGGRRLEDGPHRKVLGHPESVFARQRVIIVFCQSLKTMNVFITVEVPSPWSPG